jgi:GT2 family glycosyltransferase
VYYEGGFNYSKINNFGAAACRGDYFLLLNNDTEMIDGGCIREMLGYCMREDVGIVGAKLLYADDTIQHAGVILGFGGTAGHAFIGKSRYDTGYFGRILCAQDYSAVTAACMMTKRQAFEAVGGMTGELAVAFNDVDYCLKVRKHGWLVVYDPYAEMHHYESKSRGYEDSPEKVERFNGEVEILLSRWRDQIEQGDPYYNPNLTLDNSDFSLRR